MTTEHDEWVVNALSELCAKVEQVAELLTETVKRNLRLESKVLNLTEDVRRHKEEEMDLSEVVSDVKREVRNIHAEVDELNEIAEREAVPV